MATIYKREWTTKKGKHRVRWDAQVYVGKNPMTGKPDLLSKTFKRKGDAEKWARKQESMKDKGLRPSTTKETLAEYLEEWLKVHATQVRSSTIYNYEVTLRKWVIEPPKGVPPIGSIKLKTLTVQAFDNLYAHMYKEGMKPRGCRYLHGILRRALKDAVKKGIIPRNPTDYATVPKRPQVAPDDGGATVEAMEKEQADRFLAAARETRLSALWHVLLLGALRPSEALALKWEDVDFDAGSVRVKSTLSRTGIDKEKHPLGWKLTPPKSKKSRRTVPLPGVAMEELKKWRVKQKRERLKVGPDWTDHGFVFTTAFGSPYDLSNLCRGPYRRVLRAAGLGEFGPEPVKPEGQPGPKKKRSFEPAFRIYALRHTGASLLLLAGESLKVVSERLGHSTIVLTADTYGHLTGDMAEGAADKLEKMFGSR